MAALFPHRRGPLPVLAAGNARASSPTGNRKYWDDTGKFQPQKSHHRDLHHNWREKVYFCKLLPKKNRTYRPRRVSDGCPVCSVFRGVQP